MLAYVFVHRPRETAPNDEYLARLRAFHAVLAADPPVGFIRSWVWQTGGTPLGDAYEDWYQVRDWTALGRLNDAAVSGRRRLPHDSVAPLAGPGSGAIYRLIGGRPVADAGRRLRFSKPDGVSYREFEQQMRMNGAAAVIWKRQMVLGTDSEYLVDLHDSTSRSNKWLLEQWDPLTPVYPVIDPAAEPAPELIPES